MSKMADVSLLLFVTCELSYNSGRNNSFHGLLFLLFSPKTTLIWILVRKLVAKEF